MIIPQEPERTPVSPAMKAVFERHRDEIAAERDKRASERCEIGVNAYVSELRESDGYWYLASPYSKYPAGIESAFQEVCKAAAWLLRQGVKVYSPIAHTHPIAIYGQIDPLDHAIWLPADLPLMQGSRGLIVYMMETWEDSYGIGKEIEEFQASRKPIYYLSTKATQ